MSIEAGHALLESIAEGEPIELRVADIEPSRALEILAEGGQSHRVTVESDDTRVIVEVGNGLVVGAKASVGSRELDGREAYEVLRGLGEGAIRVAPLRFPSLANILVPVAELPDVRSSFTRLPVGEPTVEVRLPEGEIPRLETIERPLPPEPTMELELPSEEVAITAPPPPPPAALPARAEAAPAPEPPAPIPRAAIPAPSPAAPAAARSEAPAPLVLEPSAPPVPARTPSSMRWIPIVAAAVMVLGIGVTGLVWASQGEAEPAPGRVAVPARVESVPATAEVEEEPEPEPEPTLDERRTRARTLARQARRALRDGRSRQGLRLAREAADLRGGLPYYQVLLGDALHANGRRAAALRAYRRALRLRPGHGPARRRLERARRLARRRGPGSQT